MPSLYDYPRYYDIVFADEWEPELRFLQGCFKKHATGKVKRLFEPACGTGRLLDRFAREGYEVSGLDLNPKTVAFCNQRLARAGVPKTAWVADMCDFTLDPKADATFNTINSFRHLLTDELATQHLKCMAAAIRAGGLYVIGLHLLPSVGIPLDEETWTAKRGGTTVTARLVTKSLDAQTREEEVDVRLDVTERGKKSRYTAEIVFRTYTAKQFRDLLARVPEFELVETYDFGYDLEEPIRINSSTQDVLYVLRRK